MLYVDPSSLLFPLYIYYWSVQEVYANVQFSSDYRMSRKYNSPTANVKLLNGVGRSL